MNADKAIEYLQSAIDGHETRTAIYNLAIEALSKQIPQKCDTQIINRGIDISGEYDVDNNYLCPICKNVVGDFETEEHYYDYCPNCGQKLDWSCRNEN